MRRLSVAALAAVVVALATLPAPGKPARHTVRAAGGPAGPTWRWEPGRLEIARRDQVVWRNDTSSVHHVAFYDGPLEGTTLHVPAGGRGKLRLRSRGVYRYRCDLQTHSELLGNLCLGQCAEIVVR